MIVAYDLRYASDHFAGVGVYAYSVLEELLDLPGDERYLVLWNPGWQVTRFDLDRLRRHARVEWVESAAHPIQPTGAMAVGAWLRRARPTVYCSPFSLRPFASRCPEVLTLHDVSPLRTPHIASRYGRFLYWASLQHALGASFILTVSEFSRREILSFTRARAGQVRVALPGVARPRADLAPRRPAGLAEGRFALLVGDNRPRKNLELVARAWALLGRTPPLTLVGAGPVDSRFPSLTELARDAGAQQVVHLGWAMPEEKAWLYEHAEVLLFPSVYEGFGSPLAEALAAGLPALVSDIPVFREVAGDAAVFVAPHDPEAWAQSVRRLTGDPAGRERLHRAGLARAAELTYRKTAEATLAVLREATAGGR